MNTDLSIFHLVKEASFVVQFVMLILLSASVSSWTFIFSKRKELNRAIEITDEFEEQFWSGVVLAELYRKLAAKDFEPEGIEKIFLAGYKEFSRMRQAGNVEPGVQVESAQRVMRIELSVNWNDSMNIWHFLPRSDRSVLISVYSVPYGAS